MGSQLLANAFLDPNIHTYTAPSDVIQGRLKDCWLLGALAIAAAKPNLLQSNVRFSWVAQGIHAIRFFVEVEFLKRHLATKFSMYNDYRPGFGEFLQICMQVIRFLVGVEIFKSQFATEFATGNLYRAGL